MKKVTFYQILVVALLIVNVVLFYLSNTKKEEIAMPLREHRSKPKEIVIEKLNFDSMQIAKYEDLIKIHSNQIREFDKQINMNKALLYTSLNEEAKKLDNDSILAEISKIQFEVEAFHLKHFQDIKKLCRSEQIENFNELSEELARIFSHPKRPDRARGHNQGERPPRRRER